MAGGVEGRGWIKFFQSAGIPEKDAINYSISFENNRIRREQLLDLSRPILADMGITKVGDAIAIMKHAKDVHEQEQRMLAMASRHREEDHHVTSSRPDPTPSNVWREPPSVQRELSRQWAWSQNRDVQGLPVEASREGLERHPMHPTDRVGGAADMVGGAPLGPGEEYNISLGVREEMYLPEPGEGDSYRHREGMLEVQLPIKGAMYSDREESQSNTVFSRLNRNLCPEDPENLQRKVLSIGSSKQQGGARRSPTTGDSEGSSMVNARPVFERLGQKKASSKFYLESLSSKKSKANDSSVFTRLSGEGQEGEGLRKDRDHSPIRVEGRLAPRPISKPDHSGRSLDEDLRISLHQEKMAAKATTRLRSSADEQDQRGRQGDLPVGVTSNTRERDLPRKSSAAHAVKRLGRKGVGEADIFKRLD